MNMETLITNWSASILLMNEIKEKSYSKGNLKNEYKQILDLSTNIQCESKNIKSSISTLNQLFDQLTLRSSNNSEETNKRISKYIKEVSDKQKVIENLEKKNKEIVELNDRLEKELNEQNRNQLQIIDKMEGSYNKMKEKMEKEIQAKDNELFELNNRNDELIIINNENKLKIFKFEEIKEKTQILEFETSEYRKRIEDYDELKIKFNKILNENSQVKTKIILMEEIKKHNLTLVNQLNECKVLLDQMEEIKAKNSFIEKENKDLKYRIETYEDMKSRLQQLERNKTEMDKELQKHKTSKSKYQRDIAKYKDINSQFASENTNLRKELDELKLSESKNILTIKQLQELPQSPRKRKIQCNFLFNVCSLNIISNCSINSVSSVKPDIISAEELEQLMKYSSDIENENSKLYIRINELQNENITLQLELSNACDLNKLNSNNRKYNIKIIGDPLTIIESSEKLKEEEDKTAQLEMLSNKIIEIYQNQMKSIINQYNILSNEYKQLYSKHVKQPVHEEFFVIISLIYEFRKPNPSLLVYQDYLQYEVRYEFLCRI